MDIIPTLLIDEASERLIQLTCNIIRVMLVGFNRLATKARERSWGTSQAAVRSHPAEFNTALCRKKLKHYFFELEYSGFTKIVVHPSSSSEN